MFKAIRKSKKAKQNMFDVELIVHRKIMVNHFAQKALTSNDALIASDSESDLVISLTTYSHRIHDVHLVIESLGEQTVKANRIILWLDQDEFNDNNLPIMLQHQVKRGLEIAYCENLRSYKKLLPTLDLVTNSDIVTVDDDILYPYYFIEQFVIEKKAFPNTVLCYRGHKMTFDRDGKIDTYRNWDRITKDTTAGYHIFPTGVGGVLYPQNSLHTDCTQFSLAQKLAPHADDVWFKFMSLLHGTQCKLIDRKINFFHDFIELTSHQDMALNAINVHGKQNDKQIADVAEHYVNHESMQYIRPDNKPG
jgi:hypothetical protein